MRWTVKINGQDAHDGLVWARNFLRPFDTSAIEWLRINHGSNRYEGVYGQCHLPTKARPTFRISCYLPGPFPCDIATRKPPLYALPDGTFPRAPKGCRRGTQCYDPRTGRSWYRVRSKTRVETLSEGIVWIVAHEVFHFLRYTRQIPGRNDEIQADRFADEQLNMFNAGRTATEPAPARRKWIQSLLPLFKAARVS